MDLRGIAMSKSAFRARVVDYMMGLQDSIVAGLEKLDGKSFPGRVLEA